MNKKLIAAVAVGLLLLICLALVDPSSDKTMLVTEAPVKAVSSPTGTLSAGNTPQLNPQNLVDPAEAEVVLMPRAAKTDPGEIPSIPHPEYVWYTKPTSKGAIKNSKGEILFQATDEIPFVSMRSKADVSQVVIISGNRNAFLIDTETKQRVALPMQPPEAGAKGFESWEWIDTNTLLAEYYVQAKGRDGRPVSCCHGHSIAETRLYTYNLKTHALIEVGLPKYLKGSVFSVGRVANDGSIEVVTATNHLVDGKRIGWFTLTKHPK